MWYNVHMNKLCEGCLEFECICDELEKERRKAENKQKLQERAAARRGAKRTVMPTKQYVVPAPVVKKPPVVPKKGRAFTMKDCALGPPLTADLLPAPKYVQADALKATESPKINHDTEIVNYGGNTYIRDNKKNYTMIDAEAFFELAKKVRNQARVQRRSQSVKVTAKMRMKP